MGEKSTVNVWDLPLRIFHWLLVAAIAVAFLSAEEDSFLNQWHVLAGWVAGILIVFRLVWGFFGGEHSRFTDFLRPSRVGHHLKLLARGKAEPSLGHNPLGAIAVIILLGLTAAVVWTGAFGGRSAEDIHEVVGWTLLAMVAVHVAAVITMSIIERESLVGAMITGRKQQVRHPAARDARRPGFLGILVTGLIVAATIYGIVRYDPQAFTLRSAEAFEHRGELGQQPVSGYRDEEDRD